MSVTLRDLQFLRLKAKNSEHYIDDYLPAEYQYCLDALNMIVKEMWALQPQDNRELMHFRRLIKDFATEPIPPSITADEPADEPTSPSTCPELPNDGRPQPSKGR